MKYLVIGALSEEYQIDGENIKTGFIQLINLEHTNDGVIQGYQPVRINLKNSALRATDFKDAPGIYEIESRRVPLRKVKEKGFKRVPFKAELLKPIKFPQREDMLLLGARLSKMDTWKGITTYLLDPTSAIEADTEKGKAFGLLGTEETFENWNFRNLQFIPGWYEPTYKAVRDAKGEEIERISDLEPLEAFTIQDLVAG